MTVNPPSDSELLAMTDEMLDRPIGWHGSLLAERRRDHPDLTAPGLVIESICYVMCESTASETGQTIEEVWNSMVVGRQMDLIVSVGPDGVVSMEVEMGER